MGKSESFYFHPAGSRRIIGTNHGVFVKIGDEMEFSNFELDKKPISVLVNKPISQCVSSQGVNKPIFRYPVSPTYWLIYLLSHSLILIYLLVTTK